MIMSLIAGILFGIVVAQYQHIKKLKSSAESPLDRSEAMFNSLFTGRKPDSNENWHSNSWRSYRGRKVDYIREE